MARCGNIHEAAFMGRLDCVKELLGRGARPNVKDPFGRTPLHLAVMAGHRNVAELLLDYGANPDEQDASGQTPLHYAVALGHVDIEELLLERNANPDVPDYAGNTPLHIAAMTVRFSDVAEAMFEIAPRLMGPAGYPYDRTDVVRLLLEYGADPRRENWLGKTPLDLAIEAGNEEAAEIIRRYMK